MQRAERRDLEIGAHSVKKVLNSCEKSLVPDCNIVAYRQGKERSEESQIKKGIGFELKKIRRIRIFN